MERESVPEAKTAGSLSPPAIARRATRGALSLGVRQVVVQGLNVLGGVLLARLLPPSEFGVFAVTTFILNFLAVFGDVGLAASLVRQESDPDEQDYRAVFSAQQALAAVVMLVLWLASSRLASGYGLPPAGAWLFRLIGLSLLVSSFQTAPRARLERVLAFDKLAIVEVAQAVAFNAGAVLLAWAKVGVLSFAIALVLRSLTGAVLVNRVSPWRLRWVIDVPRVRKHMAFGLPYQGAQLANLAKDTITPVFIGLLMGAEAVGYINWATMVASYPIFAVTILQRLYMPLFARLAIHPSELARAVRVVISAVTGLVYTASVLIYVYRHEVTFIVFGAKWEPALVLFFPFLLLNLLLAPTIICFNVMNALGHAKTVLYFFIVWAVLTWTLGPLFVTKLGWSGWGWANLGMNFANIWMLRRVSRLSGVNIFKCMARSLLAAGIAGLLAWGFSRLPDLRVALLGTLLGTALVLLVFYGALLRGAISALRPAAVGAPDGRLIGER